MFALGIGMKMISPNIIISFAKTLRSSFIALCLFTFTTPAFAVVIDFDGFAPTPTGIGALAFTSGVEDGFNIAVNFGPLGVNSDFITPVSGNNQIHHFSDGFGLLQIDDSGGLFTFDSLFSGGAFGGADVLSIEGFLGGFSQGVDILGPGPNGSYALFDASGLAGVSIDTLFIGFGEAIAGPTHVDDISLTRVSSVPEPGALAIVAFGLVGIGLARRRKVADSN